jgi:membrane protein implicated in regulation of membrane protease activity
MQDWLPDIGHWSWLILAAVLLLLELAVPGVFFLWLALAAMLTGIAAATFIVDLSWQIQIVLFAVLSVVLVLLVRPRLQSRASQGNQTNLNQRMYNYVGGVYRLETDMEDGNGKVRIEDTLWDVTGPNLRKGARVKVVRVDGLRLVVEAA